MERFRDSMCLTCEHGFVRVMENSGILQRYENRNTLAVLCMALGGVGNRDSTPIIHKVTQCNNYMFQPNSTDFFYDVDNDKKNNLTLGDNE